MISDLQDVFPNLTERKIYLMLITIKGRFKKYGTIGLSRCESTNFGASQRQVQAFINYLRAIDAIRKVWMRKCENSAYKCNVYSLSEWFAGALNEVRDIVKKVWEYVDPTAYVKSKFAVKKEWGKLKFKVSGDRYIIHLGGRFRGKVYDVWNNRIINPLELW